MERSAYKAEYNCRFLNCHFHVKQHENEMTGRNCPETESVLLDILLCLFWVNCLFYFSILLIEFSYLVSLSH